MSETKDEYELETYAAPERLVIHCPNCGAELAEWVEHGGRVVISIGGHLVLWGGLLCDNCGGVLPMSSTERRLAELILRMKNRP
jgi:hypothetical protein